MHLRVQNAERRTAEIKRLREGKAVLYKQIQRRNDKMDEIAEATIFGTRSSVVSVSEQPSSHIIFNSIIVYMY
jgi:hypothetical protein